MILLWVNRPVERAPRSRAQRLTSPWKCKFCHSKHLIFALVSDLNLTTFFSRIRFESITGISTLSVNKTSGKAFLKQIESTVYEKAKQQYKVSVTTQDSKTEHNVSNGHSDTEAKEQESKSAETTTNQSNSGLLSQNYSALFCPFSKGFANQ